MSAAAAVLEPTPAPHLAATGAPAATANLGEGEREYRTLMRKWWFAAAIGAPTMLLSYPLPQRSLPRPRSQ